MQLPPEMASLEVVDMHDLFVSGIGAEGRRARSGRQGGGFWETIVANTYGVLVDQLSKIDDPKFQRTLYDVDRFLRPRQYDDRGEPVTPSGVTPVDRAPVQSKVEIKTSVMGIVAQQIKSGKDLYRALLEPIVRAVRNPNGEGWVVPIEDVANRHVFDRRRRRRQGGTSLGLQPTFGQISLGEAEALLEGLVTLDMRQYQSGLPDVRDGIASGQLRYQRSDPQERWRSAKEVWRCRGGDCEDLSAAVAAAYRFFDGVQAKVIVRRSGQNIAHATVMLPDGSIVDPSVQAGMK